MKQFVVKAFVTNVMPYITFLKMRVNVQSAEAVIKLFLVVKNLKSKKLAFRNEKSGFSHSSFFGIIYLVIEMTLQELKLQCEKCTRCELSGSRTKLVFGDGVENARVLVIGEAPGKDEDEQGKPFVGRSGKLLTEMLEEVGLRRDTNIYIANMLKCRPPENRDPKKTEQDLCIEWLQKQIEIIDPKVILCVGRISAQRIIGKDFSVTKQHGELIERDGRIYMGTFHPAAILRNINNKPLLEADLKKLVEAIK